MSQRRPLLILAVLTALTAISPVAAAGEHPPNCSQDPKVLASQISVHVKRSEDAAIVYQPMLDVVLPHCFGADQARAGSDAVRALDHSGKAIALVEVSTRTVGDVLHVHFGSPGSKALFGQDVFPALARLAGVLQVDVPALEELSLTAARPDQGGLHAAFDGKKVAVTGPKGGLPFLAINRFEAFGEDGRLLRPTHVTSILGRDVSEVRMELSDRPVRLVVTREISTAHVAIPVDLAVPSIDQVRESRTAWR